MYSGSKIIVLVWAAFLVSTEYLPAESAAIDMDGTLPIIGLRLACSSKTMFEVERDIDGKFAKSFDLLVSQMTRVNVKIETTTLPRNRGIAEAKNGNFDGLCVCTSDENLRGAFYHSMPIGFAPFGVISNRDVREGLLMEIRDPLMYGSRKWGVVLDDGFGEFLRQKKVENVVSLETHQQAFKMLELNRIDGFLVRKYSAADREYSTRYTKRFQYRELSRPTLHFCLNGLLGREVIERVDASLRLTSNVIVRAHPNASSVAP
jgi:ABC-type amino acid transport substrate-binding protein